LLQPRAHEFVNKKAGLQGVGAGGGAADVILRKRYTTTLRRFAARVIPV
jgi:hypothetical protein